jgi:hypothetical protein
LTLSRCPVILTANEYALLFTAQLLPLVVAPLLTE